MTLPDNTTVCGATLHHLEMGGEQILEINLDVRKFTIDGAAMLAHAILAECAKVRLGGCLP